eukprot:GILJ01001714.1.p1 GENE.GILJ01001714.1~~GILJ01001714.1.p1  ORF type:complete len:479 (-),score=60.50 GILJ01001714.1:180-1616(-)
MCAAVESYRQSQSKPSIDNIHSSKRSGPTTSQQSSQRSRAKASTLPLQDLSHRHDKPNFLSPRLPPSRVPIEESIIERTFFPPKPGEHQSSFIDSEGLFHTVVFPASKPSSRRDAILLDHWMTTVLEEQSYKIQNASDLSTVVDEIVPVLSTGVNEVVRQVTLQCTERGMLLDKMWRTYVQLFQRVLSDYKRKMHNQEERVQALLREKANHHAEMADLRKKHAEQMHKLIQTVENKYVQKQTECETLLASRTEELHVLRQRLKDLSQDTKTFLPNLAHYRSASIKKKLPLAQVISLGQTGEMTDRQSEEALSMDVSRLMAALGHANRRKTLVHYGIEDKGTSPQGRRSTIWQAPDSSLIHTPRSPQSSDDSPQLHPALAGHHFSFDAGSHNNHSLRVQIPGSGVGSSATSDAAGLTPRTQSTLVSPRRSLAGHESGQETSPARSLTLHTRSPMLSRGPSVPPQTYEEYSTESSGDSDS